MSFIGIANNIYRAIGGTGGGGAPSWVLKPGGVVSTLDIDFVNNLAWNNGAVVTIPSLLTCTRASSGYYLNADGTLTSFGNDTLRYGTNGLLIEVSRTNTILQSQSFNNATWQASSSNMTVADNAVTAPDGTLTATQLTATAAANVFLVQTAAGASAAVYAKAGTNSWFAFSNSAAFAYFNVSTGVVGTVGEGTARIETLANGWYRCIWEGQTNNTIIRLRMVDADGSTSTTIGRTMFIYGAQKEAAAFVSSYIPTTGATATRQADNITFSTVSWLAASVGTMYVSDTLPVISTANAVSFFDIDNTASAEQARVVAFANSTSARLDTIVKDDAANTVSNLQIVSAFVSNIATKFAMNWGAAGYKTCANGGTLGSTAPGALPSTYNRGFVGQQYAGGPSGVQNMLRLTSWNTQLSDANMQLVTTP